MIRINLLPGKEKRERIKGPLKFSVSIAIVAALTLLLVVAALFYLETTLSSLESNIESNKAVLAYLKEKEDEVKKYERMIMDIERKSSLIVTLREGQAAPAKILRDVSIRMPEGVWLTSLTQTGYLIALEGYALRIRDIVFYVRDLRMSEYFTDVALVEARQLEFEGVEVYGFKLNFRVRRQ